MKEQHDILTGMLNCTEAASILLAMTRHHWPMKML